MLKQAECSRKTFNKCRQQAFSCHTDALAAIEPWQEKQATLTVEAAVLEVPVNKGEGQPGTNQKTIRTYYRISVALYTPLKSASLPPDILAYLSLRPMILTAH